MNEQDSRKPPFESPKQPSSPERQTIGGFFKGKFEKITRAFKKSDPEAGRDALSSISGESGEKSAASSHPSSVLVNGREMTYEEYKNVKGICNHLIMSVDIGFNLTPLDEAADKPAVNFINTDPFIVQQVDFVLQGLEAAQKEKLDGKPLTPQERKIVMRKLVEKVLRETIDWEAAKKTIEEVKRAEEKQEGGTLAVRDPAAIERAQKMVDSTPTTVDEIPMIDHIDDMGQFPVGTLLRTKAGNYLRFVEAPDGHRYIVSTKLETKTGSANTQLDEEIVNPQTGKAALNHERSIEVGIAEKGKDGSYYDVQIHDSIPTDNEFTLFNDFLDQKLGIDVDKITPKDLIDLNNLYSTLLTIDAKPQEIYDTIKNTYYPSNPKDTTDTSSLASSVIGEKIRGFLSSPQNFPGTEKTE
ncbi:hypothetical protein HGA88_04565 [Candidatus Roizmanbacteria bacterium]|nr:hypothetical protein [Candidatus Roizmanbacteria bacterium]